MKIMKLLASCAMVGALTAVCASGAFADGAQWASLSEDKATLTINVPASYVKSVTGDDLTVLVLNEDATSVENTDILQIDQVSKNNATITLAMPENFDTTEGKKSADGTYYVRVGGAAVSTSNPKGYISTEFKVETSTGGDEGGEDVPETFCKMIGDFNADDDVTSTDVTFMLRCLAGLYEDYEDVDYAAAGYANGDEDLTSSDVTEVKRALAGIGGDNIWYYADFYYDEADEMYYVTGEIHEEMCE